jgi:hypothetical protein
MFVDVPLVGGQHRGRVALVDDEDPVQQLAAQAAHEPFARGARTGLSTTCPPAAAKTVSKTRSTVPSFSRRRIRNAWPASWRSIRRVRASWASHCPLGCALTPRIRIRRAACSTTKNPYSRVRPTVPRWNRSQARIPWAWAVRNSRQVGPVRRGAGSSPAAVRIRQTAHQGVADHRKEVSPTLDELAQLIDAVLVAACEVALVQGNDVRVTARANDELAQIERTSTTNTPGA